MVFYFVIADGAEEPRRKRRSRWAAEDEKVTIPGMPTALPTNMTPEQLEMFLCKFVVIVTLLQIIVL